MEKEKERLRKEIVQLEEKILLDERKSGNQAEEWKLKEAKFMESLKEFVEDNKNLQTEVIELKARLDGQKLKQTYNNNDSDNMRRRLREL